MYNILDIPDEHIAEDHTIDDTNTDIHELTCNEGNKYKYIVNI